MSSLVILILSLFCLCHPIGKTNSERKMTTYYFIRHAEKNSSDLQNKDPQLTKEGQERAKKWAEVFKEVPFDIIFSSDFNRTRSTAQVIADSQEKKIEMYDPKILYDSDFQKKTVGKTVLVVGHSNTNPRFVNLILGQKKYQDLDETEYGSLFIVHSFPNGEKSSEVLFIN